MIGVTRLSRVLRVLAASDRVLPGHAKLSAILIAPSDAGKSELLLSHLPPGARIVDDFTSAGLYRILMEPNKPEWLVVPDLNAVIAHKPAVANLTIANLLPLLGEGATEIIGPDGAKMKVGRKGHGIRLGLITGVTPQMFFARRGRWRATGFLRRLIPIYYTYGIETQQEIQVSIGKGFDSASYARVSMSLPRGARAISICVRLAKEIQRFSEDAIRYQLKWKSSEEGKDISAFDLPFTLHKVYRRYARAHARLADRAMVTHADIDALQDFHKFVRYDQPELL